MDLGIGDSEDKCQFEERPSKREWVSAAPDTIDAPAEEAVTCSREALDDAEYCAFHLPESKREGRDIDTGKRLRERVEAVADGEPPTAENTDFRGADLAAADLSGIDFGEMAGFSIDLRYADIDGSIDLSEFAFTGTVDCRFVRCNKVVGFGTDLGVLDCDGATVRNDLAADKGKDNRAVSLRRGDVDVLSLAEAEVAGDVFINDVDVGTRLDGESATVEGRFQTSADIETCRLSEAVVDDGVMVDGGRIRALDCSFVSAETAAFHHVTVDTLEAVSVSVERLRLQTITVNDSATFRREENAPASLKQLIVEDCELHGEVRFDRLEPDTADISIATATDRVSFQDFKCHDATFDPNGYPMFEDEVDFTGADLEGAMLRNFQSGGRASFKNADLTDARLLHADLKGAVLEGTLFSRARLIAAKLPHAYLYHASLSDASIDASTEFGDRVIYDPESSESYDPTLGLDTDPGTASSDGSAEGDAAEPTTDGGTAEKSERNSTEEQRADDSVPAAQKAKEVYQSIHNAARQSGDSGKAISTYRKRQEMETKLREQGDTDGDGRLPNRVQIFIRKVYGLVTGYGVSTRQILKSSFAVLAGFFLILTLFVVFGGAQLATPLYVIGGFVGTTPGLDASPLVSLVIGFEALCGAVLIALYVNALGRRSSM